MRKKDRQKLLKVFVGEIDFAYWQLFLTITTGQVICTVKWLFIFKMKSFKTTVTGKTYQ